MIESAIIHPRREDVTREPPPYSQANQPACRFDADRLLRLVQARQRVRAQKGRATQVAHSESAAIKSQTEGFQVGVVGFGVKPRLNRPANTLPGWPT